MSGRGRHVLTVGAIVTLLTVVLWKVNLQPGQGVGVPPWVGSYTVDRAWLEARQVGRRGGDPWTALEESMSIPWLVIRVDGSVQVLLGYNAETEVYVPYEGTWESEEGGIRIQGEDTGSSGSVMRAVVWRDDNGGVWYRRTDLDDILGPVRLRPVSR